MPISEDGISLNEGIVMCKYCEKGTPLTSDGDDCGIVIQSNNLFNLLTVYEYDDYGEPTNEVAVSINYCPMCGRKLERG